MVHVCAAARGGLCILVLRWRRWHLTVRLWLECESRIDSRQGCKSVCISQAIAIRQSQQSLTRRPFCDRSVPQSTADAGHRWHEIMQHGCCGCDGQHGGQGMLMRISAHTGHPSALHVLYTRVPSPPQRLRAACSQLLESWSTTVRAGCVNFRGADGDGCCCSCGLLRRALCGTLHFARFLH